jgi:chromosome segregation ATPase
MDLKNIKAGLKKIDEITDRKSKVETEQHELTAKIEELSRTVAGGDAKSVPALAIARERVMQLPTELKALQDEHDGAVSELRAAMANIYVALCKAYSAERNRTIDEVSEFLAKFTTNTFLINEITQKIAGESTKVQKLDAMRSVFHDVATLGHLKNYYEPTVISHANYAIKELADI